MGHDHLVAARDFSGEAQITIDSRRRDGSCKAENQIRLRDSASSDLAQQ